MISIKPGAKIKLQPEILLGLMIVHGVFEKHNIELVITEGSGARHMPGSLHYQGLAVDVRTKDIAKDSLKYEILSDCVHALGNDFDVILENLGTENEHMHVEYDPQ